MSVSHGNRKETGNVRVSAAELEPGISVLEEIGKIVDLVSVAGNVRAT